MQTVPPPPNSNAQPSLQPLALQQGHTGEGKGKSISRKDIFVKGTFVAMLISTLGYFFLPDYPSIYPLLSGWVVLLAAVQLVGWLRIGLAERNTGYDGYATKRKRVDYRTTLLSLSIYTVLSTALNQFMRLNQTRDWDDTRSILSLLLAGTVCYAIFAVRWWKEPTKIERVLNTLPGHILVIAGWAALYAIAFLGFGSLAEARIHRPAPPWSEQWAVVQGEALKIDSEAVLDYLIASPDIVAPYDRYATSPLSVRTTFLTPDGKVIAVEYRDNNPAATIKVTSSEPGQRTVNSDDLSRLAAAISTMKLGPAEALDRTMGAARAWAAQRGLPGTSPIVGLHIDPEILKDGRPSVIDFPEGKYILWSVLHLTPGAELRFWVDPATGEVLERKEDIFEPEPTPTPTP